MNKSFDTSYVKKHNIKLVKDALRTMQQGTKKDVVSYTGLSTSSCTTILNELIESNEIVELEFASPKGGRPARRFSYNKEYERLLIVSLTKEHKDEFMHLYACNLLGEIESRTVIHKDITVQSITEHIGIEIERYPNIKYVSIGVPGLVRKGTIYWCDIDRIKDFELAKHIDTIYNVTTVIENDVNAMAVGYYKNQLDVSSTESMVYIYYPTKGDPGAGIIINGSIIRGIDNMAGEIKYIDTFDKGQLSNRIVHTVQTFNYTINPNYFVISGQEINKDIKQEITHEFKKLSHIPNIKFEDDIQDHYLQGLIEKAFALL